MAVRRSAGVNWVRAALCASLLLAYAQASALAAVDWMALPAEQLGLAEQAAEYAVKYMNFRSLLCGSGTLTELLSVSRMPADEQGAGERLFLTMDVDVNGANKVVMAEMYRSPGSVPSSPWKVLLPGAIKNRKSSTPEHLTVFQDRWQSVSDSHALVQEGVAKMDQLLKNAQVILPVDNVAPKIKNILHCEVRGRDLGAEFSELTRVKDTSADIAEESKVSIVKLQASLIQKLQVKKLAYGDPMTDKTILASVDGEVTTLEKQLQTAKDTERKSLERRDKSAEAIRLLAIQDSDSQQASLSRGKVGDARKYLYVVLEYSVLESNAEKVFMKNVLGYKDPQGSWKLIHHEDYPC